MIQRITNIFEAARARAQAKYEEAIAAGDDTAATTWSTVITEIMALKVRVLEVLDNRQLVSTVQAAEMLGVSRTTIHSMVVEGLLPATRVGRGYGIPRAEIERLLREQEKG